MQCARASTRPRLEEAAEREATHKAQGPALTRASEITEGTVDWVVERRIPRAALTLLDGDPGNGKTTYGLDLTARVTRGSSLPRRV